jgi:hypothetical protein
LESPALRILFDVRSSPANLLLDNSFAGRRSQRSREIGYGLATGTRSYRVEWANATMREYLPMKRSRLRPSQRITWGQPVNDCILVWPACIPGCKARQLASETKAAHRFAERGCTEARDIRLRRLQPICRTAHTERAAIQHMRVDHRRADISVAEELLDGADVVAILQ